MANAILNVGQTGGQVNISTAAAPATPAAGVVTLYAGTDKALHALNSDGVDITIAAAGAASPITVEQTNSLVSTTTGATATACASVVVGLNTSSTATQTVAIGSSTCTTGLQAVAIGNTTCATNFSVAIGHNARATNELVVALGYQALSSGDRAVAIGYAATNTAACGIAIGFGSSNTGLVGIALGGNAVNTEACAIVIGKSACTASGIGASSVVIGNGAKHCEYGSESIIIGPGALATNIGIVSIGQSAAGRSQRGINIGIGSATNCNNALGAMAIGCGAVANGNSNGIGMAIGNAAYTFSCGIHLGLGGFSCASQSTVVGISSQSFPGATGTIVLGNSSVGGTGACNSVVIGNSAQTTGKDSVVMGFGAKDNSTNVSSVVIGKDACSGSSSANESHVAIGRNACGYSQGSTVAIGYYASATNIGVAMGCFASAGVASVAIGGQAAAAGLYAVGIGRLASASANFSQAFGWASTASHECAVAIGANISTEKANTTHVNSLIAYGQAASKAHAVGSTGGAVAINWDNSNVQTLTLTSSATVSLSNPIDGGVYTLQITQGSFGSNTITWSNVKWPGGTPPTLSTAIGALDVLTFIYGPTAYVGNANLNFS